MEVVAHINLSLSLMAFSNFNVLIKIADTEYLQMVVQYGEGNRNIDKTTDLQ
jgi:hypothetical protein